jgi:hypothetical protein
MWELKPSLKKWTRDGIEEIDNYPVATQLILCTKMKAYSMLMFITRRSGLINLRQPNHMLKEKVIH